MMPKLPAWTEEPGRVAIVHDWLTGMRGGEAILEVICERFPNANLYTLLRTDEEMSPAILNGRKVHTSYLQKLMRVPKIRQHYRRLLPLFPHAISTFNLREYDLVLSHTHCVAKAVPTRSDAVHVSYVSSPMRYIWDQFEEYFGKQRSDPLASLVMRTLRRPLQSWDVHSSHGSKYLVANSRFVQDRIRRCWQRESKVIHPFVDIGRFTYDPDQEIGDYYLIVSAFAPYKRIDLAIKAFMRLGLPLKIVGQGQDAERLQSMGGSNVEFLGPLDNEAVAELYSHCKALIFPGLEDFGITPLEAMCSGRPVIGYGRGGLLDSVLESTGILFTEQSVEALMEAVERYESGAEVFQAKDCRARALEFSRDRFIQEYWTFVGEAIEDAGMVDA